MLTPPERIQNCVEMCYQRSKLNQLLIGLVITLKFLYTCRVMWYNVRNSKVSLLYRKGNQLIHLLPFFTIVMYNVNEQYQHSFGSQQFLFLIWSWTVALVPYGGVFVTFQWIKNASKDFKRVTIRKYTVLQVKRLI